MLLAAEYLQGSFRSFRFEIMNGSLDERFCFREKKESSSISFGNVCSVLLVRLYSRLTTMFFNATHSLENGFDGKYEISNFSPGQELEKIFCLDWP